jgi:phosphatidylglycerophosphatase A
LAAANQTKKSIPQEPAQGMIAWTAIIIATAGGSGYAPVAPGTMGTIVAVGFYWLIKWWHVPEVGYILIAIMTTLLGIWAAKYAGRHFGQIDAGQIVIDEVAGFLVTMIASPFSWPAIIVGFTLFRLLDIYKPWPARYFDRQVANNWGVILDDVAAGLYGCLILQLLHYWHWL